MINLIGIPYDANSSFLKGPAFAPQRIRLMATEGSANAFAENGVEFKNRANYIDHGDMEFPTTDPSRAFETIKSRITGLLKNNEKVLSIGGDHSVSYPVVSAFLEHYDQLNILHIDAHADIYDDFDNNPYSHASPFARLLESGKIESLTQVGIRTLNQHQRDQIAKFGVNVIEMKDHNLDFISKLQHPLYISLDMDGLDPAYAPGVSHHEPGGLSTRQVIDIIQKIPVEIVGADLVEYNPVRDINNMTAMVGYKLMKELMAKML
ncbi:MAG: agmatinase [Fulvivirga sp.]